jgi:hypothetical protein
MWGVGDMEKTKLEKKPEARWRRAGFYISRASAKPKHGCRASCSKRGTKGRTDLNQVRHSDTGSWTCVCKPIVSGWV